MPEQSSLERTFETYWIMFGQGFPEPAREYRFMPPRRYRFDLAWPELKIAVELEGGVFSGGRHTRGTGFESDCAKYNYAALFGWTILRYTANMLSKDPEKMIAQVTWLIEKKQEKK